MNHIFFADDSLIFYKDNSEDRNSIVEILRFYELALRQCVSMGKSSISFSPNVNNEVRHEVQTILGLIRDMYLPYKIFWILIIY